MQIVKNPDGSWAIVDAPTTAPSPGSSAWYQMNNTDPGMLAQLEQERAAARAAAQTSTPTADPNAGDRPEGVSQYVWDRATSGTLDGLNATSVTNSPETRDALIAAGYEDWVKAAYQKHMDENANGMIANGADPGEAWSSAQNVGGGWYADNYGSYTNDTVRPTGEDELTLGGSSGVTNPGYVAPTLPTGGSQGQAGSGSGWGGNADVGTAPGSGVSSGYGPGSHTYTAPGVSSGPAVNTGIGTAGQNEATPWADAYMRASERSQATGPISGLFAKELEQ